MEPDLARIWVRTDATRQVALRLSESADLSEAPVVAWAYPGPETDFSAVFEVDGLTSRTTYHFQVEVDGSAAGPPGQLTTAPEPETSAHLRFAFGSCATTWHYFANKRVGSGQYATT